MTEKKNRAVDECNEMLLLPQMFSPKYNGHL